MFGVIEAVDIAGERDAEQEAQGAFFTNIFEECADIAGVFFLTFSRGVVYIFQYNHFPSKNLPYFIPLKVKSQTIKRNFSLKKLHLPYKMQAKEVMIMKDRIKHLRKEILKLSQTEFGKKIGLSPQGVAEIEKGRNILTDRNFDAICKAYSVNPEWLRNGEGEIFLETREALIQSVAEEFELNDMEITLLRSFLKLPAEHRQGVLAWAKNFAATLAAQMGIEYPVPEEIKRVPDDEKDIDDMREVMNCEFDAMEAARKRGISTSSASTGTSGTSKKIRSKLE